MARRWLVVSLGVALVGCGGSEPVTAPDPVGLPLDEARDAADGENPDDAEAKSPGSGGPSADDGRSDELDGRSDEHDGPDAEGDQTVIEQVEQGYAWFTEERVPIDVDYEVWTVQGAVDSVTSLHVLGSYLLVETGLHNDNPDSGWIADGLCGLTAANLYGTDIARVKVEASNGNRLARCDVLQ